MYNNYNVVGIIPVGRKRMLLNSIPYVLNSKFIDRIDLWFNPRNDDDKNFIEKLPSIDSKFNIIKLDDNYPYASIDKFYVYATDDNTIYIKIDDDIVWMESDAIDRLIEYRYNDKKHFLISPLVINNATCAHMMACENKLLLKDDEKEILAVENCPTLRSDFTFYYYSLTMPVAIHSQFIYYYLFNFRINEAKVKNKELSNRFSINCILWYGSDMKNAADTINNDEHYLTYTYPQENNLTNMIYGDVIISHYSFSAQTHVLDIRHFIDDYEYINKRNEKFKLYYDKLITL